MIPYFFKEVQAIDDYEYSLLWDTPPVLSSTKIEETQKNIDFFF